MLLGASGEGRCTRILAGFAGLGSRAGCWGTAALGRMGMLDAPGLCSDSWGRDAASQLLTRSPLTPSCLLTATWSADEPIGEGPSFPREPGAASRHRPARNVLAVSSL